MGQKSSPSLPFIRGIDQRAADKMAPDGVLAMLNNARIDQAGKIVRRLGWEQSVTLDSTGVAPAGQIRALAPLDGRLVAITTRAGYQLGPNETVWRRLSNSTGTPPIIPSPVESFAIPVAESFQNTILYPAVAAETVCCAMACSADGSVPGWYVLAAWRDCYPGSVSSLEQGLLYLGLYRVWMDDFGERHWEHLWSNEAYASKVSQLKAIAWSTSLTIAWIQEDSGPAYSVRTVTLAPRTSLTTLTAVTIVSALTAYPTAWDIDYVAGLGVYAVSGTSAIRVGVLGASFAETATDALAVASAWRIAASWHTTYPTIAVATATAITQYRYSTGAVLQDTTSLESGITYPESVVITQDWGGTSGDWRTWWTRPVSAGAPSNIVHHVIRSQAWTRTTGAKVGTLSTGYAPGPFASKAEQWGTTETAAWFYATHEDTSDRSFVLCQMPTATTQMRPLALVSPGQAALYAAYTCPNAWPSVTANDGTPPHYFWGAGETYRGAATETYPALGPRVHAFSADAMIPPSVTRIGGNLCVTEGTPSAYGPAGHVEMQPLQSPGRIYGAAGSVGVLLTGTYQYAAVYRTILPDGTEIQSAPSYTSVVVASDNILVQVAIRRPRATLHSSSEWSRYLWIDVYRSVCNGYVLQFAGSVGCDPGAGDQFVTFTDLVTDTVLAGRANLYTTGGVYPASVLPSFRVLTTHRDRLFGAHGRRLYYSTQRASGVAPYFPAGAFLELHDTITALASTEAGLLIFGRTWTWLLQGDGPGATLQPLWSPPQPISQDVGCVGQHTVHHSVVLGLTWQSDRGIELFGGGRIELISGPVHKHLASYPIVRTVLEVPEHHQVRWLLSFKGLTPTGGLWICWDTMHQQWTTENVASEGYCWAAANVPAITANTTSRYYAARYTAETWLLRKQGPGYYDYNAVTPSWPTVTITTGTIRPGGLGGYGRLRRIRILGEPPAYGVSVPGEVLSVYVNNLEDAAGDFASDMHTITVPAPTFGPTQVVVEVAPATQLCSEFSLTIISGAASAGTETSGCAWTGLAFDWETASHRARGVAALRG